MQQTTKKSQLSQGNIDLLKIFNALLLWRRIMNKIVGLLVKTTYLNFRLEYLAFNPKYG